MVVAVSMSEPDAGSALTDLKTKGEVKDDKLVINGTKRWCSGGGHADAYVVYCRLSNDPGAKAIGAVLVENDAPGLSFGPNEQLMGFRGVPSSDLYLDGWDRKRSVSGKSVSVRVELVGRRFIQKNKEQ